ncbi:MAG TPA: BTAD domain-containing putative transcriptional regulator [Longimicrobiales bacterium]|nr:BTAD domain-containing putative transcriptional regulator [Longimicrobiales bacterium]
MFLLQTFGSVDLRRDGTAVGSVLSQPKRVALLAYLATESPRGFHSRDRVVTLFWPDSDDDRARNALRQALHFLRRSLGESAVVSRGDRDVGVDPELVRCDALAFEDAIAAGRPAEALDLYQGEFLAGLYVEGAPDIERWIEEQRTRYARAAVEAARAAAEAEEQRGGSGSAALILRRALAIAPHDEAVLRQLLGVYERAGARADALRCYEAFANRLQEELGLEPAPETRSLIQRIGAPEGPGAAPSPPPAPPPPPHPHPPSMGTAPEAPPRTSVEPSSHPSQPIGRSFPWRRALALGSGLVALGTAVALLSTRFGRQEPPAAGTSPTIAVLPFANMSGDPGQDFLSDGLAEELMTALARVPGLRVVARTSAFSFKGQSVAVDSIARALRVAHVLEGSVRMTGTRLRVTANLVDAGSGYQVWGETFEGEVSDAFALQDSIARAVVAALSPSLEVAEPEASPAPTDDPAAHEDLLRGIGAMALDSPEGQARAVEFFRRALERDPGYADAWGQLAGARLIQAFRRMVPPDEGYEEARSLAERALRLDPSLAHAHVVLGRVAEDHDWDFAASEGHYRRALELSPGNVEALRGLSRLLAHLGRGDEAVELAQRILEFDPVSPLAHRWMGTALMLTGRHEHALEALRGALAVSPESAIARVILSLSLSALDRHEEAVAAAERALSSLPDDQLYITHAAVANAAAGRSTRARELLATLESTREPSAYYLAQVHGALGDGERAFELLDRALEQRDPLLPQVGAIPAFAPLREDPRFDSLLARVGLTR